MIDQEDVPRKSFEAKLADHVFSSESCLSTVPQNIHRAGGGVGVSAAPSAFALLRSSMYRSVHRQVHMVSRRTSTTNLRQLLICFGRCIFAIDLGLSAALCVTGSKLSSCGREAYCTSNDSLSLTVVLDSNLGFDLVSILTSLSPFYFVGLCGTVIEDGISGDNSSHKNLARFKSTIVQVCRLCRLTCAARHALPADKDLVL